MYGTEQGNKKIVPRSQVNIVSDPVQVPVSEEYGLGSPQLEVKRDNDQITEIEVTCSCGCRMRLVCEYENTGG